MDAHSSSLEVKLKEKGLPVLWLNGTIVGSELGHCLLEYDEVLSGKTEAGTLRVGSESFDQDAKLHFDQIRHCQKTVITGSRQLNNSENGKTVLFPLKSELDDVAGHSAVSQNGRKPDTPLQSSSYAEVTQVIKMDVEELECWNSIANGCTQVGKPGKVPEKLDCLNPISNGAKQRPVVNDPLPKEEQCSVTRLESTDSVGEFGFQQNDKEGCRSSCEIEADLVVSSHFRPQGGVLSCKECLESSSPREEMQVGSCKRERDSVFLPLLEHSNPQDYPCSSIQMKSLVTEECVDGMKGCSSQDGDKEESEKEALSSASPFLLANCNAKSYPDFSCKLRHPEIGCGIGHSLKRSSALLEEDIHAKLQSGMDFEDSDQKPLGTSTLPYIEKGVPRKYSIDVQRNCKTVTDVVDSITLSTEQTLREDMTDEKGQVGSVEVTCRRKRKAKDAAQERLLRIELEDKLHRHSSSSDSESETRLDCDTLRSFRDHLVRQKQAVAMKKKVSKTSRGWENNERIINETVNSHLLCKPVKAEIPSVSHVKALTREIAKKALLEAGFTIDFRPRKTRDYNDAVYISPEGRAYWSIPKAWDALKRARAQKAGSSDGKSCVKGGSAAGDGQSCANGSSGADGSSLDTPVHGERRDGLAIVEESALKDVFSRFGSDERLQSALTKFGNSTDQHLEVVENTTKQADLTNANLTDILLGDLGVLRRLTNKFANKNKSTKHKVTESKAPSLRPADSAAQRRGQKQKHDDVNAMTFPKEPSLHKGLNGQPKNVLGDVIITRDQERSLNKAVSNGAEKNLAVAKLKTSGKKGIKPKPQSGLRLEARHASSSQHIVSKEHSKRTILAWMIDRGAVLERERVFYVNQTTNQVLKQGVVTREGLLCACCNRTYTLKSFAAHVGCHSLDLRGVLRFTSGRSFLNCQVKAWEAELHARQAHKYVGVSEDDTNDDTCLLCGDGGDLICCDGCPSTFHASCLQIDDVPEGNWYCQKCSCRVCGDAQADDSLEELPMVLCSQCELRFHIPCLRDRFKLDGKRFFCGRPCQKIFSSLRKLVGVAQPLGGGLSWTLLRCVEEDKVDHATSPNLAIDYHSKLAVALLVIKECFNPMVDPRTNIDMINQALYNRWSDFDRLNYAGFYTAILEKEDEIVSVASIRIHGARLAEMPLIGTREKFRRQGMCRLLVGAIEKLLSSLDVAFFVLPAIAELHDTWTSAFDFRPVDPSLRSQIESLSMMVFPETELLHKPLLASTERVPVLEDRHSERDIQCDNS